MKKVLAILIATFLVGSFIALIGCSNQNSSNPLAVSSQGYGTLPSADAVTGDSTGFAARVMTTDQNSRMLTFYEKPETVIALQNCEIVRLNNVNDSPIPFSDIKPGDSVQVSGVKQQNNYIYAHRIRVHCDTCPGNYDIAFRDTIITIDYNAGSFTVVGRNETIITDENTVIWGVIPNNIDNEGHIGDGDNSGSTSKMIWNRAGSSNDTVYTFADLSLGDIVEVKAKIIDENTLLAVKIKIASNYSYDYSRCENFEATLASVDVDAKIVTFEGLSWIGLVCKGTLLTDATGGTLTLADFSAGDLVAVKGIPYSGDTLKVCEMHMVE